MLAEHLPRHANGSRLRTKVLLVDDRPENLLTLEAVLEPLGQELLLASTGEEALRHLLDADEDFSVALLDVHLPGIGGFELAEMLKRRERTRNLPIIFLTGSDDSRSAFAGYAAGAVDYIVKPYDPDILRSKVAVFVELGLVRRQITELADMNRALLDATGDAIRLVDADGNIVLTNPAMERLVSETLGIAGRGNFFEQAIEIAERTTDPEGYLRDVRSVRDAPELKTVQEYELAESGRCIRRRTGPVYDSAGHRIGQMFVLRDVTAEQQAERLKNELMSTVSHELRTPLASLLGFTELLLHRELSEEQRSRYLRTIHEETERLTALVADFLDLERIEAGGFDLAVATIDIGALLLRSVHVFSAQSAQHTLRLAPVEPPLFVAADAPRVAQVVANLLSNAIKYSPTGGTIDITATASAGKVRVTFRDEGLGIPANQQQQIFTKFFRAGLSSTSEIGGTGLGLALSKEIVEAHGGSIGFESSEGQGSTFWFELPDAARLPVPAT